LRSSEQKTTLELSVIISYSALCSLLSVLVLEEGTVLGCGLGLSPPQPVGLRPLLSIVLLLKQTQHSFQGQFVTLTHHLLLDIEGDVMRKFTEPRLYLLLLNVLIRLLKQV
jgi:hypothetical protein